MKKKQQRGMVGESNNDVLVGGDRQPRKSGRFANIVRLSGAQGHGASRGAKNAKQIKRKNN